MLREEAPKLLERDERMTLDNREVGDVAEQLERLIFGRDVEHHESLAIAGEDATGFELAGLLPRLHLLADLGAKARDVGRIDVRLEGREAYEQSHFGPFGLSPGGPSAQQRPVRPILAQQQHPCGYDPDVGTVDIATARCDACDGSSIGNSAERGERCD